MKTSNQGLITSQVRLLGTKITQQNICRQIMLLLEAMRILRKLGERL